LSFAFQIGLWLLSALVVYLLRPKVDSPRPATEDKFSVPKAQEGAEIGKVYGTVWLKDPQVVWYGDFTSSPVKASTSKK